MKKALTILGMAALLAGCATYDDDDRYGTSTGATGNESGTIHSSEQFPGQEPLPSEQRVPDDEERDVDGRDLDGDGVDLDGDINP